MHAYVWDDKMSEQFLFDYDLLIRHWSFVENKILPKDITVPAVILKVHIYEICIHICTYMLFDYECWIGYQFVLALQSILPRKLNQKKLKCSFLQYTNL